MNKEEDKKQQFDVIIIGGGPSGLTAAIYATRRNLKTLVLSADIGGQIIKTYEIENYPGFESISGLELATKFRAQATRFGADIRLEEVTKINQHGQQFEVVTREKNYLATTLILAFGKKPRELGVPGEDKLKGRGVTYCATCDAPLFRNKTVAVVGGGNSALDAALLASTISNKVYLIHRGTEFRGEQFLIDKVNAATNIEQRFETEIVEILGDTIVKGAKLQNDEILTVDGVMVEVGYVVDRSLAKGLVETDERNQVIVDAHQATSVPGIFAAGDLTPTPYKQIVISSGEGAIAALASFDYIQRLQGKHGILADWQHTARDIKHEA